MKLFDVLLGRPLATEEAQTERVSAWAGVPILGLDALGSASYGPEALLTVLLPLGALALTELVPLMAVIVGLLLIVYFSYHQTIDAYPNGGGSYTVAKENLGRGASVLAAAALSLDYLLNVAVAISAGVGALVSAVPPLLPHTLALCLGSLALLIVVNLRGVRATGLALMTPAYLFLACFFLILIVGAVAAVRHGGHPVPVVPPPALPAATAPVTLWLLARAFANGCTAMTGVEAVSNGVPIFKEPPTRGAKQTLAMIIGSLIALLVGISFVARAYQIGATQPDHPGFQSVLSQLAGAVVGRGLFYYVSMGSLIAVLVLSANTSFADFPRLCRLLSRDGFLPASLQLRGRRLPFSNGILVLGAASAVLLVAFGGVTDALIPLFALGAFGAFTMSQAGMVQHWRRLARESGERHHGKMLLNGVGALLTGITCVVVVVSKFKEGAWVSLLLIALILALFVAVRRHHDFLERATRTASSLEIGPARPPLAVVPLRTWDAVALKAMQFAIGFAPQVIAVQVLTDEGLVDDLTDSWDDLAVKPARALGLEPPRLVVLRSQYRRLFQPLLEYVTALADTHPEHHVAVVVPALVEERWYHAILHSHSAATLRRLLLARGGPQIVVLETPWYVRDWIPEQRRLQPRAGSASGQMGEKRWSATG